MEHAYPPKVSFDGGDLDCGSGLLLLIRQHIDPLAPGELLEIRSRERSVDEDLPAWCRLTGNELVAQLVEGGERSFLVAKGRFVVPTASATTRVAPLPAPPVEPRFAAALPAPVDAPAIPPLAVMGVGSWPRPRWLLTALHERLEGRLGEADFEATADDAVRLAVEAQRRAGVHVFTDGEQRRDSYASFVGARLDNCQLVPLTDLLPYVDHPDELRAQLDQLDVPADKVRHPAVFGRLGRGRPLAGHELTFLRAAVRAPAPLKIALPGPYVLARTLWMECFSDRAYADREALAADVVRVLREELAFLLADGAAIVQLDEPVLSEVVFTSGRTGGGRSFMCGALGERLDVAAELAFAARLLAEVCAGFPRERLALHVCRGNWTPDENAALRGDYAPLLPVLAAAPVGALLLEMATPRAGDEAVLEDLPRTLRLGLGLVDQKTALPDADTLARRLEARAARFGAERLLVVPDCGFATFADNPITSAVHAEAILAAMSATVARFAGR